jgi:hypothetical protein
MISYLRQFLFARKLAAAEREVFNAACRLSTARARHQRVIGHYEALDEAWRKLNRTRREARQMGLFDSHARKAA